MQRPERRFPTARLADEAEYLALCDLEIDSVHGVHDCVLVAAKEPGHASAEREVLDEAPNLEQRLSHPRSRAPGARPATHCSEWMHAVARSVPNGPEREIARRCSPACTNGHRGWKRQPGGGAARSGGEPGIVASVSRTTSTSGTDRRRLSVYGCRGSRKTSSIGPVSTTWPAYMTATRWHVWATTARS